MSSPVSSASSRAHSPPPSTRHSNNTYTIVEVPASSTDASPSATQFTSTFRVTIETESQYHQDESMTIAAVSNERDVKDASAPAEVLGLATSTFTQKGLVCRISTTKGSNIGKTLLNELLSRVLDEDLNVVKHEQQTMSPKCDEKQQCVHEEEENGFRYF